MASLDRCDVNHEPKPRPTEPEGAEQADVKTQHADAPELHHGLQLRTQSFDVHLEPRDEGDEDDSEPVDQLKLARHRPGDDVQDVRPQIMPNIR